MTKPKFVQTMQSITFFFEGSEPLTVQRESNKFLLIEQAISDENWQEVERLAKCETDLEFASFGKMRQNKDTGEIQVLTQEKGWWKCPAELGKTISKFLEKDLPFEPLVNFAINLSKNPSENSVKQLFDFIKVNDICITEDGKFVAWKKVRGDYKDIYSGTYDNSPGKWVEMPRNQVEDNPDVHCYRGLHASNWNYCTEKYATGTPNTKVVFLEISPTDVCSVPNDYSFAKMRVCKYYVLGEAKEESKEDLYSKEEGFHSGLSQAYSVNEEYEEFKEEENLFI